MSTVPDIGTEPIEHDPTGVRALLGAIPDPGPMPADLVGRIEAALAAEAGIGVPVDDGSSGSVIPFAAAQATRDDGILRGQTRQERRRVVLPWLAAAAAAGIVTVGGTAALHDHGGSIVAAFRGTGSASSAGSAASANSRALPNAASPDALARGSVAESSPALDGPPDGVLIMRTGHSYTVAGLAEQASALPADPSAVPPQLSGESQGTGPYATPIAVRACVAQHGVGAADPLLVDLATIDGTRGFVVVASSNPSRTAYAFSLTCTLLAGPIALS